VSYRTFKHLLGETSLERKCRFIFGGGILILVTTSFYLYGRKTESLVIGQGRLAARMQVMPILEGIHTKEYLINAELEPVYDELIDKLKPRDGYQNYDWQLVTPFPDRPEREPRDDYERRAVERFLKIAKRQRGEWGPNGPAKPYTFPDGTPAEHDEIGAQNSEYTYVQAILFREGCLAACHGSSKNHMMIQLDEEGTYDRTQPGDLAGVLFVKLPMEQTNKAINRNRAILIATALVTAILAMFASWTIVRYVIVRPVKHLRDVSDAIAAGKLTIRSRIETGDEFEELSHAFNRMLHNLVAMQQELRDVNNDLDRKVDELAQANMALFEMNQLKSDFLATMSHELRTPLNSIIGFSEVLANNEELSEKQRRYASNIQNSGRMLLGLINDILDLAKIESGKMEVRVEDFSIRDVCESLVSQMRPVAERKRIDLSLKIEDAIPLVRQDAGKLRQILYNLLSNALKFTPEGGRVELAARTQGKDFVLAVSDNGVGIALEDQEVVFEKFRQTNLTGRDADVLTREHEGTGLGLSIVRELSRMIGGDVKLESELGRGSTFTVTIPQQLSDDRRIDVAVTDSRVDLSKARRVNHGPGATSPLAGPAPGAFSNGESEREVRPSSTRYTGRGSVRIDPGRSGS